MNVPTREDIARLGELVVGLEEKSDQIADRLDAIEEAVRAVRRSRRRAGPAGSTGAKGPAGPAGGLARSGQPARSGLPARSGHGRPDPMDGSVLSGRLGEPDPPGEPRPSARGAAREPRRPAAAPTTPPMGRHAPPRSGRSARRGRPMTATRLRNGRGREPVVVDRPRARDGARRPRLGRRAGRPHAEGAHLAQEQGAPVPLRPLRAGHPPDADLPRPAAHQPRLHPRPAAGGELRRVPPRRGLRRLPHRLGHARATRIGHST